MKGTRFGLYKSLYFYFVLLLNCYYFLLNRVCAQILSAIIFCVHHHTAKIIMFEDEYLRSSFNANKVCHNYYVYNVVLRT
jgi:hypothetical protein